VRDARGGLGQRRVTVHRGRFRQAPDQKPVAQFPAADKAHPLVQAGPLGHEIRLAVDAVVGHEHGVDLGRLRGGQNLGEGHFGIMREVGVGVHHGAVFGPAVVERDRPRLGAEPLKRGCLAREADEVVIQRACEQHAKRQRDQAQGEEQRAPQVSPEARGK